MDTKSRDETPIIRLRLLDGFVLLVDGNAVDIQPAGQRLLAFLALTGAPVERTFAAGQLWPDASEERAKANLRSAIWRIRRIHCALVRPSKSHVTLMSTVWVDVQDGLRELTSVGRTLELIDDVDVNVVLHEDLLPDWYDDWLVNERERIRQLRLHMFERCACELIDQGRIGEAIQIGLRGIAMDSLRESAHRVVVRAHLAEGNICEALGQYHRFAELLRRELGLSPSERFQALLSPWLPDVSDPPPVLVGAVPTV
ncbi:BTAD domain-containing putative transcriptional regulator [Actinoplanes sp. M2I2]|uniref:AfsR/SARP family transcriptional regulator n=1 Tax=Actinoplanes sp. M2I2 TaxID=1734444 RepID=UPI0020208F8A|nr:BTAD domain-containing putative transcriptional regulator [Actinoplanes sp. M2I2]